MQHHKIKALLVRAHLCVARNAGSPEIHRLGDLVIVANVGNGKLECACKTHVRHDRMLLIILAHTLVHKTQPIVQLCRALVFFELIDIPISVRHSGQSNRFKAILRHAVKRIQLFHRAEFLLQIFAVSCTAVFAEAILNGAVTDLVPRVPKDQIFALRVTLGYLFNKSLGSRLHVGIGEARTPAAVKRTVRAAAKLLTARTDARALVFFKHVLGGTFQ